MSIPRGDTGPAYSGDGATVVFSSNRDGDGPQIWAIKADGSNLRRLTNPGPANDIAPYWWTPPPRA